MLVYVVHLSQSLQLLANRVCSPQLFLCVVPFLSHFCSVYKVIPSINGLKSVPNVKKNNDIY